MALDCSCGISIIKDPKNGPNHSKPFIVSPSNNIANMSYARKLFRLAKTLNEI